MSDPTDLLRQIQERAERLLRAPKNLAKPSWWNLSDNEVRWAMLQELREVFDELMVDHPDWGRVADEAQDFDNFAAMGADPIRAFQMARRTAPPAEPTTPTESSKSNRRPEKGLYMRGVTERGNTSSRTWKPVCPKCRKPLEDGEVGDVKNYPDDGGAAVFFMHCGTELEFFVSWKPTSKEETVHRPKERP